MGSYRHPSAADKTSDLRRTLCDAIEHRAIVAFVYRGQVRTAEPHILGVDHAGEAILSAWQLSGGSGVAFRTYRLEAMSDVRATQATFAGPRAAYNPRHNIFAQVVCQL